MGGGAGKLLMGRKRLVRGLEEIRWPQQSLGLAARPVLPSAGRSASARRHAPVTCRPFGLGWNGCQGSEETCLAPGLHLRAWL